MQVFCFPNGNTAVCDEKGDQVPALQKPWLGLLLKFFEREGAHPETMAVALPNGFVARPFKTERGEWNWHVSTE